MTNNKQQSAVEWFSNQAHELFEQYSEGKFDRITLNKLMLQATAKAKEMEKEQIAKAFDDGDYNYHYSRKTGDDFEDGKEYFNEVYK
jgi:secreted Zn-dependent insulinase-like peptidase